MLSGGEGEQSQRKRSVKGGDRREEEKGKGRGENRRKDGRKKRERSHRKMRKRQAAIFRFEKRRHRFVRKILVFAFLRSS